MGRVVITCLFTSLGLSQARSPFFYLMTVLKWSERRTSISFITTFLSVFLRYQRKGGDVGTRIKQIQPWHNILSFGEFYKHVSHWYHPYNFILNNQVKKKIFKITGYLKNIRLKSCGKNGLQLSIIFIFKDHLLHCLLDLEITCLQGICLKWQPFWILILMEEKGWVHFPSQSPYFCSLCHPVFLHLTNPIHSSGSSSVCLILEGYLIISDSGPLSSGNLIAVNCLWY